MTDRLVDTPGADEEAAAESDDAEEATAEPAWTRRVWYRSRAGLAVIAVDLLLTVLLVAGTVVAYEIPFSELGRLSDGVVPPYVYAFSLFGAVGFVFTALIEEFDSSVGDLLRYNFRLPAAVPLGVGIYLLSGVIFGEGTADFPLVAGTVFLGGLYVNLAYKRLGALARRLLPGRRGSSGS